LNLLEQAIASAGALKDIAKAGVLAARIPILAVQKVVQIQNFIAEI
jgi:hypothetical protein